MVEVRIEFARDLFRDLILDDVPMFELLLVDKASSGNNLNVSAIAVVCYTTVFGFGPDDPHECQGMRLKHACV